MTEKLMYILLTREVEDIKLENLGFSYEFKHPKNKGEYHTSYVSLDSLTRMMKEWLYGQNITVSSERTAPLGIQNTTWYIQLEGKFGFHHVSEFEAVFTAFRWVVKEREC